MSNLPSIPELLDSWLTRLASSPNGFPRDGGGLKLRTDDADKRLVDEFAITPNSEAPEVIAGIIQRATQDAYGRGRSGTYGYVVEAYRQREDVTFGTCTFPIVVENMHDGAEKIHRVGQHSEDDETIIDQLRRHLENREEIDLARSAVQLESWKQTLQASFKIQDQQGKLLMSLMETQSTNAEMLRSNSLRFEERQLGIEMEKAKGERKLKILDRGMMMIPLLSKALEKYVMTKRAETAKDQQVKITKVEQASAKPEQIEDGEIAKELSTGASLEAVDAPAESPVAEAVAEPTAQQALSDIPALLPGLDPAFQLLLLNQIMEEQPKEADLPALAARVHAEWMKSR